MVRRGYSSIRNQTSQLNVHKGGSTHLYVDQSGPTASDLNDGYDWDRPKKTIGGAIASLRPWTEVWIRGGTYTENVVVPYENVVIHGVIQDGTAKAEIKPASGVPLTVSAGYCEVSGLSLVSTNAHALVASGPGQKLHDLYIEVNSAGVGACYGIHLNDCDRAKVQGCHLNGKSGANDIGVLLDGGSVDCDVSDNYFEDWGDAGVVGYGIGVNDAQRCMFLRNIFNSGYVGIYFYTRVGAQLHSVFGNQFYANSLWDIDDTNVDPDTSGIRIGNNFFGYAGWFDDADGDGIADAPVQCNTNWDYKPLSAPHFISRLGSSGGGGGAGTCTDLSGTIALTNTTEQFIEFLSATYGKKFFIDFFMDLRMADIDYCYLYDSSITTWTNQTSVANNMVSNSVLLVPSGGPGVGDCVYFGSSVKFHRLDVYMEGGTGNTDNTIVWEYYNGAAWVALATTDGTSYGGMVFGKSGSVTWVTDPGSVAVNAITAYWVRARVTTAGVSLPKATHVQVSDDGATGFDSLAAFGSSLEIRLYRKLGSSYVAAPVDLGLPFTQCILYRTPDINSFKAWGDVKVGLKLTATPSASISISYAGYSEVIEV